MAMFGYDNVQERDSFATIPVTDNDAVQIKRVPVKVPLFEASDVLFVLLSFNWSSAWK